MDVKWNTYMIRYIHQIRIFHQISGKDKITLPVVLVARKRTGSAFHSLKVNLFQIEYVISKNLNYKIENTSKFLTTNLVI